MEYYQILDVERLTGIKAHTIRIWEKRYALIVPHRTATNIRYYDDAQVKKILNVATLIANGIKISKVAALSPTEFNKKLEEQFANTNNSNVNYISYINDLISATLAVNETEFEKTFQLITTKLGIYEAMLNVVYPFLTKVGYMWTVDKSSSFQEHFATAIIRQKIMVATDGLKPKKEKNKQFLLYLPPDEWHEIGLLFANYIIRLHGHRTVYLGQNVPYESVEKLLSLIKTDYLLSFYVLSNSQANAHNNLVTILNSNKNVHLLLAGNQTFIDELHLPNKRYSAVNSVQSLLAYL
ncbi:MAG: MerR family transcriptional regulator [Bacteroidia bacterium]|nr:MerR family transcriptional regulator [Bacteroidia bacterium]